MSDLRNAAEAVLEAWDWDWSESRNKALKERMEALRQALAQPEQEPVGYVTIENISSWAQVPSIKWFKKPTEGPLYTAPVDAVNMSQERVYETAKREHEPVCFLRETNWSYEIAPWGDSNGFPVYTAPPKREWVGLEDEDVATVKNEFNRGALWAEQMLKEKNGG